MQWRREQQSLFFNKLRPYPSSVNDEATRAIALLILTNKAIDENSPSFWDYSRNGSGELQYELDLDKYLLEAMRDLVSKIKELSKSITAEVLLSDSTELFHLDVAFMFLLRLSCGSKIMTPAVLQKIRNSWCRSDLPESLFKLLSIGDDNQLIIALKQYQFNGGQEKTQCLVKHNLLSTL